RNSYCNTAFMAAGPRPPSCRRWCLRWGIGWPRDFRSSKQGRFMPIASNMKGKAVLVTGAASGLGRATALALGRAGADLCIVDVNAAGLQETASQLGAGGVRSLLHATDLAERDNCGRAVSVAVQEFGRLDALCNVAGVIVLCNAHEMREVDFEKTLAVNLSAPFYLMRAAIPHLLRAQGAVVNVTSSAAFVGEAYA